MRAAIYSLILTVGTCCIALAQPAEGQRRAPFTPGPPVSLPECTCRAQGRDWRVGENVCLRTATGHRLARCSMVQNVTNWTITDVPCATSMLIRH